MKTNRRKWAGLLAALLACSALCMALAYAVQTDFGGVRVTTQVLQTPRGEIAYKLYRPASATEQQPAPGVLLLHGYQNDKDTSAAYAVELARRGAVVVALDEYGHGSTAVPMRERGYVDHKLNTSYGLDREGDGSLVEISGPVRYRVMMNFSNLSFFRDRYSTDSHGNKIQDSSMGGIEGYALLAGLPYVDSTRLGISGHSMGTWASWSTAAAYAGAVGAQGKDIAPRAVVLQCGELFTEDAYDPGSTYFNNVLLLTAKYDEFNYFRDFQNTVSDALLDTPLRLGFLGVEDGARWNTTYGDFSDGSARRCELIRTNHRLTTHDGHAISAAMDWFGDALELDTDLAATDQRYQIKEIAGLAAMLLAIAAMIPLMELLLTIPFFKKVVQPLPDRPARLKTGGRYWREAALTILIAGLSYPFMTQLGHGLLPVPENIFRMTIGNGFLSWYLLLSAVMLITMIVQWKRSKKRGQPLDYYDLGFSGPQQAGRIDWFLCGRGALLACCMVGFLYGLTVLYQAVFQLDLRFIWPFFRGFSAERFGQFLVYLPVFLLFFLLNNSKVFAQMIKPSTLRPGLRGFVQDWYKNALCMTGGVLLMILLEYLPFFAGIGPGADLLFGTTFGGPFMSLMIVFVPQVLVFSVLCTYCYRRTANIYTGGVTVACMACWIVTGGSAIL
ncbi:hypothetical protein H8S23_08880 [Anaerofilum sp. BX8]|uniref:Alpha/beta hydrolase family protein n=1 Tax=Anaerofilum hominis TaxID=2763016 RepID=A0A923KY74_9FIRM|nr:alpha/beta hydrolase [Anaerofilum hominis]MBC5581619.1 hypothetical protein [Anaerofilum hominis]